MDVSGMRVATVRISNTLLAQWLSSGTEAATVLNPLKDLKVIDADFGERCVQLLVTSPDLEVLKEDETPPEYLPTFKSDTSGKKACGCVVDC